MKKCKGFLVFALFLMLSMSGIRAEASTLSTVTGVKQVDAGTSWVDLEWGALLNNGVHYEAAISTDGVNWVTKDGASSNSMRINNLNAGSTYKVRVRAYTSEWNTSTYQYDKYYGNYSSIIDVVTSPNSNPRNLKHTSSTVSTFSISWDSVPGANAYVVECINHKNSSSIKKVTVTATKATISGLSKNTTYYAKVYPIRKCDGYTTGASWSAYSTIYDIGLTPQKLKVPSIQYYWQNLSEISVNAQPVSGAKGYQYQLYTAVGKGSKVATKDSNSSSGYSDYIRSSKLKKHRAFKLRARAYTTNTAGKKYYGGWSDWKYVAPQPDVVGLKKVSGSKIRVKWDTIDGASRYILYGSTKKDSGYKKITTTKKTSFDVSKVKGSKLKKNRTYYFKVEAQKSVGGKYKNLSAGNTNNCWYIKYR